MSAKTRPGNLPAQGDTAAIDAFTGIFNDYAPTVYILPGDRLMGIWRKIAKGPDSGYGPIPVITFEAIVGTSHVSGEQDSAVYDLEPGKEYSLFVLNTVTRERLKEFWPIAEGEKFAYTNHGMRDHKTQKEADGTPKRYHHVEFVMPDRPQDDTTFDLNDL